MTELWSTAALWLPGAAVMTLLILASGFFSGSETALFYLSREELQRFQNGRPRERIVADLLRNPDRLLTAVLFWNLLVNLTYFAVSVVIARRLVERDHNTVAGLVSLGGVIAIIIFGEVLPKSLAVVWRRPIAALVGLPLAAAARVLDPVMPLLGMLTRALRRAVWPQVQREPFLDAEDLEKALASSSSATDDLEQAEQQALRNVLELSEMTVEEVMRPRNGYLTLRPPIQRSDLRVGDRAPDYVFIPGDDGVDRVLSINTFTAWPDKPLEETAKSIDYVPWCSSVADALDQLRRTVQTVLGVVNEYGEVIGILTYEDIVETIFEPKSSRVRRIHRRDPITPLKSGGYQIDGMTSLRYLAATLGIEYEASTEGQTTVAGYLHEELERFPEVGDVVRWHGLPLEVITAGRPEAVRVRVSGNHVSTGNHADTANPEGHR